MILMVYWKLLQQWLLIIFIWDIFYHHRGSSIMLNIMEVNYKIFTLLYCHWSFVSRCSNFRVIKLVKLIVIHHLWWSWSQLGRCAQRKCVWSVICLLSYYSHTWSHNFLIKTLTSIWFSFFRWLVTFSFIRFFTFRVVYVDIDVSILHENNLFIKIAFARQSSLSFLINWFLSFWGLYVFGFRF